LRNGGEAAKEWILVYKENITHRRQSNNLIIFVPLKMPTKGIFINFVAY
jgi:hypothetical protein